MYDEKNSSGKAPEDEITADDLLAQLKLNYDGASEKREGTPVSQPTEAEQLSIDDEVFLEAKDILESSDAVTASDDSDLDVDELIDMYITKPKAESETAVADLPPVDENGDDIVREITREAAYELDEDTHEYGEYDGGDADDKSEDAEIDEAFTYDEDDDVTLADALGDEDSVSDLVALDGDIPEYGDEIAIDTATTAVFETSKVKNLSGEGDAELDEIIDEAFADGATEVFDRVNGEDTAGATATEQVYGNPDTAEINQTDLHLLLAFGMEEELRQTVGEDKATEIEDDIIKKHDETAQMNITPEPKEYTSREQNDEVIDAYEARYKSLLIRMAGAAALLICMFFIENFSLLGLSLPEFMRPTSYPLVYAMIDLQLVIFSGVLVYKQLIEGCKGLITERKTTPEVLTAFMLAASVIYTFAVGFSAPASGIALYNLPVVLTVLLSLIFEFMNLKREVYSFNVVCAKKKKFVVTPVSDETESLERDVFGAYIPDDSQIIKVGKTDFVDGFFRRSRGEKVNKPIIGILIPALMVLAIVFVILALAGGGRAYEAFTLAFLAIALTAPLSLFVVYSYPFYKASKDSFENESAIIGEASLGEYSTSAVISFEDKEVFPSSGVKVTSIKVFGQNRLDEVIYNVASAFIKVGGPLSDVFSQATHDMGYSDDVELACVDEDGFSVTVDGEMVHLGKASYMEKKDYEPPFDSEGRAKEQNGAMGVLYVAFGGQLAAKIYVLYTIDGEFEGILGQLYKTGMCVGIKSFDPSIDDLLLAKKIRAMKYPVKVIRAKTVEDIPHTVERCDSGIVSKRSVKALLRTLALCERVGAVIRTDLIVGILAMLIGAVIMILVHAFGLASSLPSLYALLYQIFWLIPVALISRFLI